MKQVVSNNDVTAEEAGDSLEKNLLLLTLFCRLNLEDSVVVLQKLPL